MIKKLTYLVEKYRHGDTANSFMLAFTQSVVAFIFIIVDFIFSKKMGVYSFGVWKQMFFIIGILVPLLSFGVPEGFKYFIAKENNRNLYFSNMLFMLLASTAVGLIVFLFVNLFSYLDWIQIGDYYLISILFPLGFLFFNLNKALRYVNINDKKVLLNTKVLSFFFVPTLLVILIFGFYFEQVAHYYLWIGLFIYLLVFGAPLYTLIKKSSLLFNFKSVRKKTIRQMLKVGFPLYLSTFIGMLIVNFDKGIVSFFENKATFAIFSVGAMEIPVFAMLSAAFSQQTYPQLVKLMSNGQKEEAKKLWMKTTIKVSYITYPMILILMVLAKPFLFFIYSNEYGDAVVIFQIYLLVGLLRNNYYGALIIASGNTKFITYYAVLTLVFNVTLSLILYSWLGINGIVYGTLISALIIALLQLNHEGLLKSYFINFIGNFKVLILIILVLIAFLIF